MRLDFRLVVAIGIGEFVRADLHELVLSARGRGQRQCADKRYGQYRRKNRESPAMNIASCSNH